MNFDVCLIFNNQTLAPLILFINWTSALTPHSSHTTHSLKGFSSQILASFYSGFEVNIITQTIILGCLSEIRKHHETLFVQTLYTPASSHKNTAYAAVCSTNKDP